jgi:quercetin dioxygenase-like cupin family protein
MTNGGNAVNQIKGVKHMYHCTFDEFKAKSLTAGVDIKSLTGEKMSMVIFNIAPGSDIPEHAHPHEQMGTVLKGALELTIGEEKKVVRPGDAWRIPSDVVHSGHCLDEAAEVLEFFAPPREDYS